jgi:hypothetical protein
MSSAAAARLLADIDRLAYPERMRLLAGQAQALADAGALGPVLEDLYAGDRFQREIALFIAVVAGHQPTILAALSDPDWYIHRSAVSAWLRSGEASAAEIAAFVIDASWRTRRHVYRLLRRLPGLGVADELIGAVWERFGDDEAGRLLPACSPGTLARLLPELGHAAGNWALLGERHPEVVVSVAGDHLAGLAVLDRTRWWGWFGAGVIAAAPAVPHRVLDLLERYGLAGSLPGDLSHYAALARADSGRLITLMTAPERARWLAGVRLPTSLLRHLSRLDTPMLAPVARRVRDRDSALAALLEAVPPSRRAALYDAAFTDVDRSQSRPSDQILNALPRARRWAEARRVLGLAPVRARASLTLHYTAFLPWQQAQVPLTEATRRAAADDRGTAYELMVGCAARTADPAIVTEVIAYLQRLRNEQDPVRARALTALARVSPLLVQPEAAAALEQIAADALAARDASTATLTALTTLAVMVLRGHTGSASLMTWALRTLERMFGNRLPVLGRIDTHLRRGQEAELFAAVRDRLEAGLRRGSCDALFAITRALHRRAWRLPQLQDMLRRAIDGGNVSAVMRQGIQLWLADPATRAQRAEHVLLTDSSTVTLRDVWAIISTTRTDLLDLVLTGTLPRGKFLAADARWVPLHAPGVRRWLPRQQAAYAALLASLAADAGAKIYTRTGAIAAAAQIPSAGWDVVHSYVGSADTTLSEAALGALARTDRPADALPTLLRHAGDDRARVALYAAGRAARFLPPQQLSPVLTGGPLANGKVTSRKEALRLAAILSVPDAGDILHQAWTQDRQHRGVRAAVVSAARQRLHDPRSWAILGEAATGTPEEILAVVSMAIPFDCAPRYRRGYGQLITHACASTDERAAQAAWLTASQWAAWTPELATITTARLTDLGDRSLWRLAVPALAAVLSTGRPGSLLRDVTSQLADLDSADGDQDEPGRDRPARQRLRLIVDQAATWASQADPGLDRTPLTDAGRLLSRWPDLTFAAATLLLAAAHLGHDDGQRLASQLAEICDIVTGQPVTAARIADSLACRATSDKRANPDTIRTAARLLHDDGRLSAGLFAVALTQHGKRLGWPIAWRTQIRQLRTHPHPDVRTAALTTIIAAE